jgi:hypothetical protein
VLSTPVIAPRKAPSGDCRPAPSSASICSRDGMAASRFTWAASIEVPSSMPPFTAGRASFSFAKSDSTLAAPTGSFVTTSPVGPLSRWPTSPDSFTARSARVFLMTTYSTFAFLRRRRRSVIRFTLSPVKSV